MAQGAIARIVDHINQGHPLILWSRLSYVVGDRLDTWDGAIFRGEPCTPIHQTVIIVRECTFDEWRDNLPAGAWGRVNTTADSTGVRFYEVKLD